MQPPSERTRIRQRPQRARYDRDTIAAILDEGLVCHVGFVVDGVPWVIPTAYGRAGDRLYVHGGAGSRLLRTLAGGVPVCVTVTLLDGLVLARSAFHHSMNYRSVVVPGTAEEVTDPAERLAALRAIVEHLVPGRWDEVRGPSEAELRATRVVRIALDEASAKVRTGPPIDDADDLRLGCWVGELPLALAVGTPVADPALPAGIAPTATVTRWRAAARR